MNLNDAQKMANEMVAQHLPGWRFDWNQRTSAFGVCHHSERKIALSRPLTFRNDETFVRNVMLHEIAHALVGPGHGHGPTFKLKARSIGAPYEHTKSSVNGNRADDLAPYEWACDKGHTFAAMRRPSVKMQNRQRSCPKCCPGRFNAACLLTFRVKRRVAS